MSLALSLVAAIGFVTMNARASSVTLCGLHAAAVAGGSYIVDNNEFNSATSECVSTNGGPDFTVAGSGIDSATGSPDAYPSIYAGCHWGLCSWGGLTSRPIPVSRFKPGLVTTDWSTTQPDSGIYDVSYDVWFNQTPATTGLRPDCTELMVWLNHTGQVQPYGSPVASDVTVGGRMYNVFEGQQPNWDTVSYEMTTGVTSVRDLDIGSLALDAVSRGFLSSSCYLIDVEAGFELWQGGAGLATNSFSVTAGPKPPSPHPSHSPSPSPSPSPSTTQPSPSPSPSTTRSPSPSPSTTRSPSPSPTAPRPPSATRSPSPLPSTTRPPSTSPSATRSPGPATSRSPAPSRSSLPSPSSTPTASRSPASSRSPTPSPTATWSTSPSVPPALPRTTPPPTPTTKLACAADYSVLDSWPGGLEGQIRIRNRGSSPIRDWTATWSVPGSQLITELWNAVASQAGTRVTVTSEPGDAVIPSGGAVTLGFIAVGIGSDPGKITLNGTACG